MSTPTASVVTRAAAPARPSSNAVVVLCTTPAPPTMKPGIHPQTPTDMLSRPAVSTPHDPVPAPTTPSIYEALPAAPAPGQKVTPLGATSPSFARDEFHNPDADTSRHSMRSGELVSVRVPWPEGTRKLLIEAQVSNGRATASLISRHGGETRHHTFREDAPHVIEIDTPGFERRPDALYLLLLGIGADNDVDIHTEYFP
ncbi:hypothetical protein [Pararobbsia alpina]|uniref:hypothetical protein n=1 Tax=Pararobbsia alpina TaxID=621374 RepID=UPI0039A48D19